nr:heavy metal-associated domain-containing protein [Rhodoferax fermentans]
MARCIRVTPSRRHVFFRTFISRLRHLVAEPCGATGIVSQNRKKGIEGDLRVHDITCESCVKHVTTALQAVPGVTRVEVDLASGRTRVVSSGFSKTSGCQSSLDNKVACCCA